MNGVPTTYVNDLASGLTQILEDGTYTYIYGLGRIAQVNGPETEYFLGDRLGSVRQLADAGGSVTLAGLPRRHPRVFRDSPVACNGHAGGSAAARPRSRE